MRAAAFLVTTLLVFGAVAVAQDGVPLGETTHYRFLPDRSVFVQTGGFAGVNSRYAVHGDFDFTTSLAFVYKLDENGQAVCVVEPTARFDNANVYAPLGPMLPAFIDVGHLLNLESLWGERLPLGAPFDVYRFRGVINDGVPASPLESSTIELYAAQAGPWMYLWGETTPPAGSADLFSYEIKAVARSGRWADWNDDGVVNAADYTVARDLQSNPAAFPPDWDGEYALWRDQFGEKTPDVDAMIASFSAAMASSSSFAIPEPSCLVLVALAMLTLAPARK